MAVVARSLNRSDSRRESQPRWQRPLAAAIGLLLIVQGVGVAAILSSATPATAQSQVRSFTLYVRDGYIPMPDGSSMYVWGFTDDPNGPPQIPGPAIVVDEGDTVDVTLVNDRDPTANTLQPAGEGHTVHLHGLDTPMEHDGVPETFAPGLVRQGESYTYRFRATHAGTYFYHCHQNNVEHQQMGMFGPLIVRAARNTSTAYTGGPAFDREHTLVLSEMATEGHEGARASIQDEALPYNWLRFQPDFSFINDRPFARGSEVSTNLEASAGERVLVRMINAGYTTHTMRVGGSSPQIVASDGRPWTGGPATDTVSIGPGEKYDLLVQAGGNGILVRDELGRPYAGPMVGVPRPVTTAPQARGASTKTFRLYVRDGSLAMPDGAQLPVLGFTSDPNSAARVPGPAITVDQGDNVEITLVNDRDSSGSSHRLGLKGIDGAPAWTETAPPGGSQTYRFRAERAGSYLYVGNPDTAADQLGMYGAVIVNASNGAKTVYDNGPAFDQQYTMVLSEVDSRAAAQGASFAVAGTYSPNYFLINGLAYPDTMRDPGSMIHANVGDRVLIRAINAGRVAHAMHLHGYHFTLASVNGRPWLGGPSKDTVLVAPGESYDLLFTADQPGAFPFHDHFETANTNNGIWLGGMHTMAAVGVEHQVAPAPPTPAPSADTLASTVFVRDNFYTPNQLTVPVGTTVRWDHQGLVEHTVTSLRGLWDSGAMNGGEVFTYTFTTPGRYDYFCRFHLTNRGAVIVQ